MYIAADISADTTACYLSRLELKQLLQEHSAFFPSFFHEIDAVTGYHNGTSGLTHATCSIGPHADPTDTQGFPKQTYPVADLSRMVCPARGTDQPFATLSRTQIDNATSLEDCAAQCRSTPSFMCHTLRQGAAKQVTCAASLAAHPQEPPGGQRQCSRLNVNGL